VHHELPSPLSEITLTEMNLRKIKQAHPNEVTTVNFNQVMEGYTGGDWEWWFHGVSGKWVGFRMQAKLIDPTTLSYPHLHYQNKAKEVQADILIRASRAFRVIPLYCLYSYWARADLVPRFHCGSFPRRLKPFGCSLLRAEIVLRLRQMGNRDSLADVLPFVFPWHCLVCCSYFGGTDLSDRAFRFWDKAMGGMAADEGRQLDLGDVRPRDDPPSYVSAAQRGERIQPPDENLAGLAIIEEGPEEDA
jgi:hypothetical protein